MASHSRHLHDPDAVRRNYERLQQQARDARASGGREPSLDDPRQTRGMSLTQVQKWVMSVLAVTTIGHLAAGLALAAVFSSRPEARVGLNVIAAAVGVAAVVVGRVIHQKSPISWWLLLGLLPGLVGAWFTFR